jgi:hypothetical protein
VGIYASTEASGHLPVVILTETVDNNGRSIANRIEQIAAEVLNRCLPGHNGLEPPFASSTRPIDSRVALRPAGTTRSSGESFDLGELRPGRHSYVARIKQRVLHTLGTPDWRHLDRAHVQEMVGEALPWPACTCHVACPQGSAEWRIFVLQSRREPKVACE